MSRKGNPPPESLRGHTTSYAIIKRAQARQPVGEELGPKRLEGLCVHGPTSASPLVAVRGDTLIAAKYRTRSVEHDNRPVPVTCSRCGAVWEVEMAKVRAVLRDRDRGRRRVPMDEIARRGEG
jgi:hypothetical protein